MKIYIICLLLLVGCSEVAVLNKAVGTGYICLENPELIIEGDKLVRVETGESASFVVKEELKTIKGVFRRIVTLGDGRVGRSVEGKYYLDEENNVFSCSA